MQPNDRVKNDARKARASYPSRWTSGMRVLAIMFLAFHMRPAFAYECREQTIEERLNDARDVFLGQVIRAELDESDRQLPNRLLLSIRITESLKGGFLSETIQLGSAIYPAMMVGGNYIFILEDGTKEISMCNFPIKLRHGSYSYADFMKEGRESISSPARTVYIYFNLL